MLMVVRLPALKARMKRQAMIKRPKQGRFGPKQDGSGGAARARDEEGVGLYGAVDVVGEARSVKPPWAEVTEMEKKMSAKFCYTGFWRSP
ncbi:hypothetical protein COCNU_04G005500 [Cocos nucifera]|uniref:Uncharacterized protein n=1 Tax=Cocos nucifera TaxID=13894 RepID=A0A8K0I5X1_COCNU|nr:hypothetical protein COCNU_04G005500 [Cocos nucifera]